MGQIGVAADKGSIARSMRERHWSCSQGVTTGGPEALCNPCATPPRAV